MSAAESIFERELLNLRLSGALLGAFNGWKGQAIRYVLDGRTGRFDVFDLDRVFATLPDTARPLAQDLFDHSPVFADILDSLRDVNSYARGAGLDQEATVELMRGVLGLDTGVTVPVPTQALRSAQNALQPVLTPAGGLPHLPEHPMMVGDLPFATVGHTYRTRLEETARTLATSVSGYLARQEAEATGQDLRWVTMGDHRVRSSHRAAQGQTVAHDEWFTVGGIPMEYPGDPAAPDDETINCRCTLTLVKAADRRYVQAVTSRDVALAAAAKTVAPEDQPEPLFDLDEGEGAHQRWETFAERGKRLADEAEARGTNPSLTAAAPAQARAPKGTPIGGEWIDTPYTLLDKITAEARGETLPEPNQGYTPQRIADEYAAALTKAWNNPTLEVTVNGISGGDTYGTKLMGVITDRRDGEEVGSFERTMYADGHVSHDQFKLAPEWQGAGMGSKMQAASEDYYRSLGYDRITVHANIDVGGYTWARQGYEFQDKSGADDVIRRMSNYLRLRPDTDPRKIALNDLALRVGDAISRGAPMPLPAEFAAIGWTDGADKWAGKIAMLGSEWNGVKHIAPGQPDAIAAAATADARANAVAQIHRGWVPNAGYDSIPVPYDQPSQYPETEEDVHTHTDSDADYWVPVLAVLGGSLTAAAPNQARAPKGTPIGGQWIDTPGGMLADIGGGGTGGQMSVDIGGATYTGTAADPTGREDDIRAHGGTTPTLYRSEGDPESAQAFQNAIQAAKDGNKFGASVYVYPLDDYKGMTLWLTADGTAGVALHGTDIVSVFNAGSNPDNKGFVQHAMATAQAAGGTHADAFDTVLPKLYAEAGMQVVARVPWDDNYAPDDWDYSTFAKFNGGRPDVVFLKYDPATWWGSYTPGQGKTVADYEEGVALTASASGVQAHVDRVVVPLGGARVGDRLRGGVDLVRAQAARDEVLAILLGPVHLATVHREPGGNPSSEFAAPNQARAPKGVPIGGQWIDTPNALLHTLGWGGEEADTPTQEYTVPATNPPDWSPRTYDKAMADKFHPEYTPEQAWAIQQYTGQAYVPINAVNRGQPIPEAYRKTLEDPQKVIDLVDSSFAPIPGDARVYRGVGSMLNTDNPDGLVGSVLSDKTWLSSTVDPFATQPFTGWGKGKGILQIDVPKGTPIVWPGEHAAVSGEGEMILPKNTPIAITGWHEDPQFGVVYEATVATPSN